MKPAIATRTALTLSALLAATACGAATAADTGSGGGPAVELRLPDPGNNGALAVAKKDGSLDRALAAVHARAVWTATPADGSAAAQLDTGALDIADTPIAEGLAALGEHPSARIFGAAKPDLMGEGVLVKNSSKLRTVKDLAGRRIAVEPGSAGEYLLLKALEQYGVPAAGVERVHLDRAAAEQAFRVGDVDGWAASGSAVVGALTQANAHLLAAGRNTESDNYRVWLVRGTVAAQHPEVVRAFYDYLHDRTRAYQGDPASYLNVFTDTGPQAVAREQRDVTVDFGRGTAPVEPVTPADTERLERVARLLSDQKVTSRPVAVRPAVIDVETLPEHTA